MDLVLQKAQLSKKREYLFQTYQFTFVAKTDHVSATVTVHAPADHGLAEAEQRARAQVRAFASQLSQVS